MDPGSWLLILLFQWGRQGRRGSLFPLEGEREAPPRPPSILETDAVHKAPHGTGTLPSVLDEGVGGNVATATPPPM